MHKRVGIFLAFVEACLFGLLAALHLGLSLTIAGETVATPFLYPAAIVEGLLALALLIAVVIPGDTLVRAGRVMGAQLLAIIAMFVVQVALMRAPDLVTVRNTVGYGIALLLALASIATIALPRAPQSVMR